MVSEQLLYVLSGLACLLKISGPEYEILFLTFSPLHWYFWLSVLLHMSILMLVPCCLIIVASFEIRSVNSPTFFFFKIALFIQGPLQLYMNFRIIVSIFAKKKVIRIVIGMALITLESTAIFMVLGLLSHEFRNLHLSRSSVIYFSSACSFQCISLVCFGVKFIHYFFLFGAVVNETFLNVIFEFLLVYSNTTDFCMLILYPVTSLIY